MKKRWQPIFFLFFIASSFPALSNTALDSLLSRVNQLADPERSKALRKGVQGIKELPADEKVALISANAERLKNLNTQALELSHSYYQIAEIYFYDQNPQLASPFLVKALSLIHEQGTNKKEWNRITGKVYNLMAYVFFWQFQPEKAMVEQEKALEYFILAQDTFRIGKCYNQIGVIHSELKDSEKALEYYQKSKTIFEQLDKETFIIRSDFCTVVDLIILERFEEAKVVLEKLLPRMKAIEHVNYHLGITKLGQIHMELGNYELAETLFRESYENAKATENINAGLVVLEKLIRLSKINNDYREAFTYSQERANLLDTTLRKQIDEKNIEAKDKFEELGKQQKIKELEYEKILQKSKFRNWIVLLCSLFLLSLGALGFWVYRQSIRKKQVLLLSEKEKEIQKVRERLLTAVTHELRTPLTLIVGKIDQLQKTDLSEKAKDYSQSLHKNAEDLLHQINQLLDWKRLEANAVNLHKGSGDIAQTLRDLFNHLKGSVTAKNIHWQLDLYPEHLPIQQDFEKIKTIVTNLLTNALKYSPDGGRIKLSMEAKGQELLIRVEDEGPGIAPAEAAQIFDWYFRAQQQAEESAPGFGVGLALSKELALLIGGDIQLDSQKGKGSIFSLSFPFENISTNKLAVVEEILPEGQVEDPENKPSDPLHKKPHLLLVEDHLELAQHLQDILSNDFEVVHSPDAIKGMAVALEQIPDIIITDLMLPKKNGLDFCKELKNHLLTDHIPVLILTAKTDLKTRYQGLHQLADAYLTKPFKSEELLLTLQNLLKNRRRLRLRFQMQQEEEPQKGDPFLDLILETLEKNYSDNDFNVDAFAQKLKISRGQLSKKSKALLGASPSKILRHYRLEAASKLLKKGQKSVSEVAYSCGFSSPEYFSTVYKEHFKVNPKRTAKS